LSKNPRHEVAGIFYFAAIRINARSISSHGSATVRFI
jgi:hypothetical protein